jgi:hypothetical protein
MAGDNAVDANKIQHLPLLAESAHRPVPGPAIHKTLTINESSEADFICIAEYEGLFRKEI